jgi:hypothetical protein
MDDAQVAKEGRETISTFVLLTRSTPALGYSFEISYDVFLVCIPIMMMMPCLYRYCSLQQVVLYDASIVGGWSDKVLGGSDRDPI